MSQVFEAGFNTPSSEIQLDSLPIKGNLPEWLEGTLVRNGPGTFQAGQERYRHWFDGHAMLHKFAFGRGRVAYANKFLRTRSFQEAQESGRIAYSEFATDPCRTLFGRAMAVFAPKISDNAKVNVAHFANRYLALAETPIQVEFDPETLATVGNYQYESNLVGQMTTVHPHFDTAHHLAYNLVVRFNALSFYRLYSIGPNGKAEIAAQMPVREPAYMHSFGMSKNYLIVSEFPLVVNPISLLLWLKPYIENYHWKPGKGAPFHVFNRRTGEYVGRFETDAYFAFHHVNAFEVGDDLFIDIDAYDDASILNTYYLERLADTRLELPFGRLRRYRLPLKGKSKTATYETLSESCMELARFDYEKYNMDGSYRYVYACSLNPQQRQGFYNQILKLDLHQRSEKTWYQPNCYPGEPVFVGKPGRTQEDDGVILSVVLDAQQGNSFLLVLDAHSFEELARAEVPHPVLFGYHGEFFNPTRKAS